MRRGRKGGVRASSGNKMAWKSDRACLRGAYQVSGGWGGRLEALPTGGAGRGAAKASAASGEVEKTKDETRSAALRVVIASLGVLLFGYHLSVVNLTLPSISESLGMLTLQQQGAVVSVCLLGAAIGAAIGGGLADALGRIRAFTVSGLLLAAGAVLCGTAWSLPLLLGGRVLCGVGFGIASTVVPVYMSEVAPARFRGAIGSVNQLTINVGILLAVLASAPSTWWQGGWRYVFLAAVPPAGVFAASPLLIADSQSPGQGSKRGGGKGGTWRRLLLAWPGKAALGAALFAVQQLAGINAVIFFSAAVFREAGLDNEVAASAAVGLANIAGTCAAAYFLDWTGRKPLLFSSFLGMAFAMGGMAFSASSPMASLVATLVYVLCFALGAGPIPAIMVSELFPSSLRGKAASLSLCVHWICNALVGQSFLPAVGRFGISFVFSAFAVTSLLASLLVALSVPETKGRSLNDVY